MSRRELAIKTFTMLKISPMGRDAGIRNILSTERSVWGHDEVPDEPLFVGILRIDPGKGDLLRNNKQAI